MATTSLIFSSPGGGTALVAGSNRLGTFPVEKFASIRLYAFVRPQTPQVTLYLINPELHDHTGTNPRAGALDEIVLTAFQGHSAWYPVPGVQISIEVFTTGPGGIDIFVYGRA